LQNGAVKSIVSATANQTATSEMNMTAILNCVVSDYLSLAVYQDSGGARDIVGGNNYNTSFAIEYLGA
jgi:hypothetical protein